jgi:hypothetical protein
MSKRGSSSFNRSADMRIAIGRLRKMSVMVAIALAALAQPQSRSEVLPAFEVATIKPTDPAFTLRSIQIPPNDNTLTIRGLSLKELIQFCWGKATLERSAPGSDLGRPELGGARPIRRCCEGGGARHSVPGGPQTDAESATNREVSVDLPP